MAAGAQQIDVARAQGISPALPGHFWQRQALEAAALGSAERDGIMPRRAPRKRVGKVVTIERLLPHYPNRLGQQPLRLDCALPPNAGPGSSGTRVGGAPGRAVAHRTRVASPGTGLGSTAARAGPDGSRRPQRPVHQPVPAAPLPRPHRPGRHGTNHQPAR